RLPRVAYLSRDGGSGLAHRIGCDAPHAEIREAVLCHGLRLIEIAAIDDDRIAERFTKPFQIEGCELAPVSKDDECVRIAGGVVSIACILQVWPFGEDLLRALDGGRVEGRDEAAFGKQ